VSMVTNSKEPTQLFEREVVCVIPARGGSKGIPLKNLKKVGDHSLVARSIRACFGAELTTRVIVSTDHADIASEALRYGAQVIGRPRNLSGDMVSSESAVSHVIRSLGVLPKLQDSVVVLVQATSPFTKPQDLDETVRPVLTGTADSVFTAKLAHPFSWHESANGFLQPTNHEGQERLPRQVIPPTWIETGAVYTTRIPLFMESQSRFNGRIKAHAVEPERALEIDSWEELELAQRMTWLH